MRSSLRWQCLAGVAAAQLILRKDPWARIVVVTGHAETELMQRLLSAGALGYVLKLATDGELVLVIRAALRGDRHVSPGIPCSAP
jgi:DNA-binding NarL/FixJ family response regulator